VKKGAPIARLHVRTPSPAVADQVLRAFRIGSRPPRPKPLVIDRVTSRPR
jgi:hypothetical protein